MIPRRKQKNQLDAAKKTQQKGDEDADLSNAATRIQSVHRGKAARKSVQGTKSAQRQAEVRWKARALLDTALHDGALRHIISVENVSAAADGTRAAKLEGLRLKAGELFKRAHETGDLGSVLAMLQDGNSNQESCRGPEIIVNALKQRFKVVLLESANNGQLELALTSQRRKELETDIPELRQKMRNVLEGACIKGTLDEAFASTVAGTDALKEFDIHVLQRNARQLLEAAATSGALQEALAQARDELARSAMEQKRLQMREKLGIACESGVLQKALGDTMDKRAKAANDIVMREMRLRIRSLLEVSANEGTLEQALKDIRIASSNGRENVSKAAVKLECQTDELSQNAAAGGDLKFRTYSTHVQAPTSPRESIDEWQSEKDDAELSQAAVKIQSVHRGATARKKIRDAPGIIEEATVEDVRLKTREALANACHSGELRTMLTTLRDPSAIASSEDRLAEMRLKMQSSLVNAVETGELERAVEAMKAEKHQSTDPKYLRTRAVM
jgi:hypothetical protein